LEKDQVSWKDLVLSPTFGIILAGLVAMMFLGTSNLMHFVIFSALFIVVIFFSMFYFGTGKATIHQESWHHWLEGKTLLFTVLTFVAILIGGAAQIIPAIVIERAVPMKGQASPYTALELAGRDVYIREGCNNCHTQMVRSLLSETIRYGKASESWEFAYDHPHLWGSKRTGPDLARVGGKYPDLWHYKHMINPRSTSFGSLMPDYAFLENKSLEFQGLSDKLQSMKHLGVPYSDQEIELASDHAKTQAQQIVDRLAVDGIETNSNSELLAMIAYLQKLGMDARSENGQTP
ncbi:MAG: cytochrome-c oxidase, cbb3-type subunit II, partial [Bdellovibrionales bacterium]|nr:cytochrome-c oxidase, cbb3-type subunit II [Bdellovibrionales bacterium]